MPSATTVFIEQVISIKGFEAVSWVNLIIAFWHVDIHDASDCAVTHVWARGASNSMESAVANVDVNAMAENNNIIVLDIIYGWI